MKKSTQRLVNSILYFCRIDRNVETAKVGLLLFLLDFEYFAQKGESLTGLTYLAHPDGPVPDELYLSLGERGEPLAEAVSINGHSVVASRPPHLRCFTSLQRSLLTDLTGQFLRRSVPDLRALLTATGGPWDIVWRGGRGEYLPIPYALAGRDTGLWARGRDTMRKAFASPPGVIIEESAKPG